MTATLPTPHPMTGAVVRGARRTAKGAGWLGDRAWWTAFGVVARYPKSAAGLTAYITSATPVTLREVTGVVVGGSAASVLISLGGPSGRGTNPLAILPRLSTYRRRRARVRRRWVTVMQDCGLAATPVIAGTDKRRPQLVRVRETAHGLRVYAYAANVSAGPADFRKVADKLRAGFGCRDVKVSTHRHMITLDLQWTDPLARPIKTAALPRARQRWHVVVGLDEHAAGVEKDVRLPNLVIGAPGSGKSTETWTTLHGLQRAGIPHRVRVFDPKGGMELGALKGHCWRYVSDPSSWDTFLGDALVDMTERQQRMAAAGLVEHTPTETEPLDVMVVDELVTALAMGGAGSKVKIGKQTLTAEKAFLVFLSQCRAAGFSVLASTQVAEKNVLGAVRDLFPYVSVLRVGPTETSTVDMALGSSAHKAYPAHELAPGRDTAGIGWMRTAGGVIRYRAAYLTDAQRAQVVRHQRTASTNPL